MGYVVHVPSSLPPGMYKVQAEAEGVGTEYNNSDNKANAPTKIQTRQSQAEGDISTCAFG